MSLILSHDYEEGLRMAIPVHLGEHTVHPPPGALGDISTIPSQTIPPVNTNIQFDILPEFKISEHPGLADIDHTKLPKNFNWRHNGGKKKYLMSKPGNQMLCGSCWAISAAGIVADNHVVSGTVDWIPNLSTTWCLACYPQLKCKGGNPAKLYEAISKNGIASNHCIDYSWCSENPACNGKATKHFKAEHAKLDLSTIVPSCGCYDSKDKHYLYFIDKPKAVSLGKGGMKEDNFTNTIKKHIYHNGPVQGGFVVMKNFMHGAFTKVNGGVFLEDGVYGKGDLHFDKSQTDVANYVGSHAIAIIGWGVQDHVVIDNKGTKKDIPYWYCRNSWTEKWGDGGYFKMAMYPYNKIMQFDKMVTLHTPKGVIGSGGMVLMNASKPPESKTLPQIKIKFGELTKSQSDSYYQVEGHNKGESHSKYIYIYIFIGLGIIILLFLIYFVVKKLKKTFRGHSSRRKGITGRAGSYFQ
jgi:hypothetical protein